MYFLSKVDLFFILLNKKINVDKLSQFDERLFTKEIIDKYGEKILQNLDYIPDNLKNNYFLLELCFKLKKYNLIECFDRINIKNKLLFDNKVEEFLNCINEIPDNLKDDSEFFHTLIKYRIYQNLNQFSSELLNSVEINESNLDCLPHLGKKEYIWYFYQDVICIPNKYKTKDIFEMVVGSKKYEYLNLFPFYFLKYIEINSDNIKEIFDNLKVIRQYISSIDEKEKIRLIDIFVSKSMYEYVFKYFPSSVYIEMIDENNIEKAIQCGLYPDDLISSEPKYTNKILRILINNKLFSYFENIPLNVLTKEFITDDTIKYICQNKEFIKYISKSNNCLNNSYVVGLVIKNKLYDYLRYFDRNTITEDMINVDNFEDFMDSICAINKAEIGKSAKLLSICLSDPKYYKHVCCFNISNFDDTSYTDQQLLEVLTICNMVPNIFRKNERIFNLCLKHNFIELINYFDENLFARDFSDDDLIKILDSYLDYGYFSTLPLPLHNERVFDFISTNKLFKYINRFNKELIPIDIVTFDNCENFFYRFSSKEQLPVQFQESNFLQMVIDKRMYKKILLFNANLLTEDMINLENVDEIFNVLNDKSYDKSYFETFNLRYSANVVNLIFKKKLYYYLHFFDFSIVVDFINEDNIAEILSDEDIISKHTFFSFYCGYYGIKAFNNEKFIRLIIKQNIKKEIAFIDINLLNNNLDLANKDNISSILFAYSCYHLNNLDKPNSIIKISDKRVFELAISNVIISEKSYFFMDYFDENALSEDVLTELNVFEILNYCSEFPLVFKKSSKVLKICLDNKLKYINKFSVDAWKEEFVNENNIEFILTNLKNIPKCLLTKRVADLVVNNDLVPYYSLFPKDMIIEKPEVNLLREAILNNSYEQLPLFSSNLLRIDMFNNHNIDIILCCYETIPKHILDDPKFKELCELKGIDNRPKVR